MHKASVGIFGASGYSGVEATRILAAHPKVELRFLTSDRWVGDSVARRLGPNPAGRLRYVSIPEGEALARECAAVLLATPNEGSLELVPKLVAAGVKVIDLSGSFRLKQPSAYPTFYGFSHAYPQLLDRAVYGLPELFREEIAGSSLVANPGCYPTAASLALAPLIRAGVIEGSDLIVDAASGVTGAGRKASEDYSFSEVDADFRAYRVLKHQHTPEIRQTLARVGGREPSLTFTPHLLPVKRGILSTAYARLRPGVEPSAVTSTLSDFYASEPFVTVLGSPDEVNLKAVVGTNRCLIAAGCDQTGTDPGRVVVVSAIDNLVKGAAGQAVQNLNLVMGWDESLGLELRGLYP